MSFQAYLNKIEEKTGKGPDDFKKLAEQKGFVQDDKIKPEVRAGDVVKWLKEDFELGHGHSMAIYALLKGAKSEKSKYMRKLIVSINVTLDGYMSGPNCELYWHFKTWSNEMSDALCIELAKADTILLGRVTYSAMAKYWTAKVSDPLCRGEDFAFANMMNIHTKIVFSKTITSPEWNNSKLATGNLADEINLLKKKPGKNIIVYGSGRLVSSLIKSGLVDEYQLWLHPVVLGRGKPLFRILHIRLYMKMVNIKTFGSGVVLLCYQNKINENETTKQKSKRRILKGQF